MVGRGAVEIHAIEGVVCVAGAAGVGVLGAAAILVSGVSGAFSVVGREGGYFRIVGCSLGAGIARHLGCLRN